MYYLEIGSQNMIMKRSMLHSKNKSEISKKYVILYKNSRNLIQEMAPGGFELVIGGLLSNSPIHSSLSYHNDDVQPNPLMHKHF